MRSQQSIHTNKDKAVSPTVGVILLVAIAVIMSVIVTGTVFLYTGVLDNKGAQDIGTTISYSDESVDVQIITGSADTLTIHIDTVKRTSQANVEAGDTISLTAYPHQEITVISENGGHKTLLKSQTILQSIPSPILSFTDTFEDNSFDTSRWFDISVERGDAIEKNGRMYLEPGNGNDNRAYLRTAPRYNDGDDGNDVEMKTTATITDNTGKLYILPHWDGEYSGNFAEPKNAIGVEIRRSGGQVVIKKWEDGSSTRITSSSGPIDANPHDYRVVQTGHHGSIDIAVYVDGNLVVEAQNIEFNPSKNTPFAGFASQRRGDATYLEDATIIIDESEGE